MAVIRAFIAIDLTQDIRNQIDAVTQKLRCQGNTNSIRWVPAHNIHLTLKFLGEVSSTNLELLKKIISQEASRNQSFEFSVKGLGAFPSVHRPRVIWVGIDAPPSLLTLQKGIENETQRLGYTNEDRGFSPHLTLGRISHNASPNEVRQIGDILSHTEVGFLGKTVVRNIDLFRSDLHPTGAVYTSIFQAPLIFPPQ